MGLLGYVKASMILWLATGFLMAYLALNVNNAPYSHLVSSWKGSPSSLRSNSIGAVPDVPFDVSLSDEQLGGSADLCAQKSTCQVALKLVSGSCYLPHPEKVKTGGEDAHFICDKEQAIGVADGVGGWAEVGIDAGEYARELMSNCVSAIKNNSKASINPLTILENAYAVTKSQGSSTACIIALTDQGIDAINLGDSGFVVIRDGSAVFRSAPQQYGFNYPYQLSHSGASLPSHGQVFHFPVKAGDVVVVGTDGLFDNLYMDEIVGIVHSMAATQVHLDPQLVAQKIAALAQERGKDQYRQTPFSASAHEAGLRYHGGKLDDITVVVSYVTDELEL